MRRLPGLDLLRAMAIIWVMLFHAQSAGLIAQNNHIANYGWMGVDLFFALSGFLIGGQLFRPFARGEREHLGWFYARRLFRTLPPYLVVLALYFAVPIFREVPRIQPLWQFLTFTENLFIDYAQYKAFSHVWSLCIEEQFYLVVPPVVWLLMRRPSTSKAIAACAVVLIGGMAWRGYVWSHDLAPIRHMVTGPGNFYQLWLERIYYATWTRLDGLLCGVVFAMIKAFRPALWERLMRRAGLVLGLGIVAVGLSIDLFIDRQTLVATVVGYPVLSFGMACLVVAGASPRSPIGRWRIPGAGLIAAMAYSLYLTHKEAYHLVGMVAGAGLVHHPLLTGLAYGGAVLAMGGLLYVIAERPALGLRDRWVGSFSSRATGAFAGETSLNTSP